MRNLYILLFGFFFICIHCNVYAQNAKLEVQIIAAERSSAGDCFGCGDPDPAWVVRGYLGGTLQWTTTLTFEEMSGTLWNIGYSGCGGPSPCYLVNNVSTSETQFVLGLDAWENDCDPMDVFNSCTFNNDWRRCNNQTLNTITFRTTPAFCIASNTSGWTEAWSDWCGNFRVRYAYRWSFASAPTIITQPTPNTTLCIGSTTNLSVAVNTDATSGLTYGRFYQWQVSENTDCSGATGWTDIPGATSATFTPPQISGTRLYRVRISSNCTSDFSTQTTTSNCSRVTYHPYNGTSTAPVGFPYRTGDNAPPIQSGICGSTVLPGSTYTLNTLQPPAVDAMANNSAYTWAASGGTLSSTSGASVNWTSPATPGTYTVTVTYNDLCAAADASSVCTITVGASSCDFIYVSPTGTDVVGGGGPLNPYRTIAFALANMSGKTHMKIKNGTYNESTILSIPANIIVEGGYNEASGIWTKNSISTTNIICSATQTIDANTVHVMGFSSSSSNNWKLIDLNISTVNATGTTASGRGRSNYAIHVNNSTGYEIIRCNVVSGNASNGNNGSGLGANGSSGSTGFNGNSGSCDGSAGGTRFGPGGPGGGIRQGGSGGNGGAGGPEGANNGSGGGSGGSGGGGAAPDFSAGGGGGRGDCDGFDGGSASASTTTQEAANGSNGSNGASGAAGSFGLYFVSGPQAANGADGGGGGGGAGGGGGGGQGETSCWSVCDDGGGNGGGTGGSGGEGGQGGAGGFGGGSSFALYVNGTAGSYLSSVFTPGALGNGGSGQTGGSGGSGGNGGFGATSCTSEIGGGGNGSRGGNGGSGGNGGNGANGIAASYYLVGTGVSNPSTSIVSIPAIGIPYNNLKLCANSVITLTKTSGNWNLAGFGTGFNFVNNSNASTTTFTTTSSPVEVFTNTRTQDANVSISPNIWDSYLQIASDNRPAPVLNNVRDTFCVGNNTTLTHTNAFGIELEYDWRIYSGTTATGAPVYTYTTSNSYTTPVFSTAGTYLVKYQVREQCCGWSIPAYRTIVVRDTSLTPLSITGTDSLCTGNSTTLGITGTVRSTDTIQWFTSSCGSTLIGTGSTISVSPAVTTTYFVRIKGVCNTTPCISKTIYVIGNSIPPSQISGNTPICAGNISTLFILDGTLAPGAVWRWHRDSCNGPIVGTGTFVDVTPLVTTTYFIRAEGICDTTLCRSFTVTVNQRSTAPTGISGTNTICLGRSTVLSRVGGTLGTGAVATWYSGVCGGTFLGTGDSITVFPTTTTDYFVRIEGICDTTVCQSRTVTVNDTSIIADSITGTNVLCSGGSTILSVSGGYLGTGANWNWYTGSCGGTLVNTGSTFNTGALSTTTTYYVRAVGTCNTTSCLPVTVTVNPLPNSSISGTTTICPGGAATLTFNFSVGTPPYSIQYTDGASVFSLTNVRSGDTIIVSPLTNTTYTLNSITDSFGCVRTSGFLGGAAITVAPSVIITGVTSTNVKCNGAADATISINISGGASPYNYSIDSGFSTQLSPNFSGLDTGTYYIYVRDNNNCFTYYSSNPIVITQPPILDVTATTINASCGGVFDGSITATASGGTPPYQYSLNGGAYQPGTIFSGLAAGTYTVQVQDANLCTDTFNATINNSYVLQDTIVNITHVSCFGLSNGSITVNAYAGISPFSYSIDGINFGASSTFTGLAAGSYTIISRDSRGCQHLLPISITSPAMLSITLDSLINGLCGGSSTGAIYTSVMGGTSPYTYLWSNGAATDDISLLPAGSYTLTVTDFNGCSSTITQTISTPAPLFLNIAGYQNVRCNGASNAFIDITVNGGVAPYSFVWSNGATTEDIINIPIGNYLVTVTDNNGCSDTISQNITQPLALSVSGISVNPLCNAASTGSIDLTVTGGTSPYTYVWSNGATTQDISALAAGSYSVVVHDANNCIGNAIFTITQPPRLLVNAVATNITCYAAANGTINVSVSGGSTPYTYLWNDAAVTEDRSALNAGNYSVTVTDNNGCIDSTQASISEPDSFRIVTSQTNVSCSGRADASINLSVMGATAPYTYLWSDGSTLEDRVGLSGGPISVTVSDANGCSRVINFIIIESAPITTSVIGSPVTCYGGNNGSIDLTVGGGTTPYTYLWNTFANTQDLIGVAAGLYTVIVTDANGCTSRDTFTITQPPRLLVNAVATNITCYAAANGTIDVSVSGGSTPYTYLWNDAAVTEDRSALNAGNYSVTVTDNNGCIDSTQASISEPDSFRIVTSQTNVSCSGRADASINLSVMGATAPYTYLWSDGSTLEDRVGLSGGPISVTVSDANGCSRVINFIIIESAPLTSLLSATNPTCFGGNDGSINLTTNGGTTPYSYLWNTFENTEDISGLNAALYTVIITDANGCTLRDTIRLIQPAAISITHTSIDLLCAGASSGSIDLTVSGGTLPYAFAWSDGGTTEDRSLMTAGTYTVTVTDFNSCTATHTVTITSPSAIIISGVVTPVRCAGGATGAINISVSGGVSPYSYNWGTAVTEDISFIAAGTYTVTVTDFNSCVATQSFVVTEPTALSGSITTHDVTCFGGNDGSARVIGTGGTAPYNYFWSIFALGDTIFGQRAGTYSALITDFNGCQSIVNGVISSPADIQPNFSITSPRCFGANNGFITTAATGGVPPYSYLWSTGATSSSISSLTAGTYILTITDFVGCTSIDTAIVLEPVPITIAAVLTNLNCHNDNSGQIDITVTGGTPSYGYSWTLPDGSTYLMEDITTGTAGRYIVYVNDLYNCVASDTFDLTEPDTLLVNSLIDNVTCAGALNGRVDVDVNGGIVPYRYIWSTGATSEDLTPVVGGTYTVTVTDAHNCTAVLINTVVEPIPLVVVLNPINPNCNGAATGSITTSVAGGTSPYLYNWSTFDSSSSITGLLAGTYYVTVTDANNCAALANVSLTEPTAISLNASTTNLTCYNNASGSINLSITSGGVSPFTYLWSNGAVTEDLTSIQAGVYTITVTDAATCTTTATYTLTQPDSMFATISGASPGCLGATTGFAQVTVYGGTPGYTYQWNTTPVQTSNIASSLAAGNYTVTSTDSRGCSVINSITLATVSPLTFTVNGVNTSCSSGTNGSITVNASGGNPPYQYFINGVAQSSNVFTNLSAGTYSIEVHDANSCEAYQSYTITSPSGFVVDIVASDQVIGRGDVVTLTASTSSSTAPIVRYDWSPMSILTCIDPALCNQVTSAPEENMFYTVTAINADSCTSTDTITIYVRQDRAVFIPTVFSPNGDGKNETFDFMILGAQNVNVSIWDRFGENVYFNQNQLNGEGQGWDGRYKGQKVPLETYTYQFIVTYFDGTKKVLSGSVSVIN